MDYTTLTVNEVRAALRDVASEAERLFGGLTGPQLNWRPASGSPSGPSTFPPAVRPRWAC